MFWRTAGFFQNATKLSTMTPSAAMMTLLYSKPEPAVLTSSSSGLDQWGCRNLSGGPPFLLLRFFVFHLDNRYFNNATPPHIVQSDCMRANFYIRSEIFTIKSGIMFTGEIRTNLLVMFAETALCCVLFVERASFDLCLVALAHTNDLTSLYRKNINETEWRNR